jgi:hypothetical protein
MGSKVQFMWELVVVSIGKHYMVMDLHLCLPFQSLRFVRGVAAAAPRKKLRCTETLGEKTESAIFNLREIDSKCPNLAGSEIIDLKIICSANIYLTKSNYNIWLLLQTMMSMSGPC